MFISMGWCKKDVTPLLTHRSYVFLALTHRYIAYLYNLHYLYDIPGALVAQFPRHLDQSATLHFPDIPINTEPSHTDITFSLLSGEAVRITFIASYPDAGKNTAYETYEEIIDIPGISPGVFGGKYVSDRNIAKLIKVLFPQVSREQVARLEMKVQGHYITDFALHEVRTYTGLPTEGKVFPIVQVWIIRLNFETNRCIKIK